MKYYLIDVTSGYLSWMILTLTIWGIFKLIKRENLRTINYRILFIISLIGLISPTLNLLSGKYHKKTGEEMSDQDKASLKHIIKSCLSGQEINKETHNKFYLIIDKYKIGEKDIDSMLSMPYNESFILLQKSFYDDAIKTIQTKKISESKIRMELEEKLLNKSQKERNKEYLKKILENKPIDINGEPVVLNEEICNAIIDNIDEIFSIGRQNFSHLKNREAFK
jgi:hypothetical protein